MNKTEYEEALYTAKLIVSKRVSDWAVSHHAIVELAKALEKADEQLKTVATSLREIVARRERVTQKNGGPNTADGSDGRYARARAALEALDAPEKPKGGLAAIAGKWPGEESGEEMAKIFAELAKSED